MRHAKALVAVALFTTVGIACADMNDSMSLDSRKSGRGDNDSGDPNGAGSSSSGGGAAPEFGSPAATGVVVAHSATFPSFRLCFENYPDKLPQPDSKVMPGANVVGVEVGGAVRIDALPEAAGMVYVIDEARIRVESGAEDARTCGQLISEIGGDALSNPLIAYRDYYFATKIERPLGVGNVDVLAITGCADAVTIRGLDQLAAPPAAGTPAVASCGGDWKPVEGNLAATALTLAASPDGPTESEIPVAIFNLSPAAAAVSASVEVKFGPEIDAGAEAQVSLPLNATAFETGGEARLAVDQTKEESYGRLGFDVISTIDAQKVTRRQSLADVQQLSAPGDIPTTYYRAASNYALLVLGDPSHSEERAGGGANPAFNPRRALHIVAVPVLDPAILADAGAEAEADASTTP
ncbi:MAG: hypothetical protein KIT84_21275 [Labilithrix sp.]|nr:hypothetical protein [Labilithrix sp.]MCW5813575.1 hypothetical protein [Labilithrix sp.]